MSLPAHCEVKVEVSCFSSGGERPIRFELRTYYDDQAKWSGAFVRYEKSRAAISLADMAFREESFDKNAPSLAVIDWVEVSGKSITGEYEMISQGTNINSMTYTNAKSHKIYSFIHDSNTNSSVRSGCEW
jgi:hypothetical protein